jgi:hypothetical protein
VCATLVDAQLLLLNAVEDVCYSALQLFGQKAASPVARVLRSLGCIGTQIAAAKLARKYPGVRLHTHLAENQEDIDFSLKTYGCRPGEYLK